MSPSLLRPVVRPEASARSPVAMRSAISIAAAAMASTAAATASACGAVSEYR